MEYLLYEQGRHRQTDPGLPADHDLAHFKSLKKFDGRVYIWYTLKQVSKIIFQNN